MFGADARTASSCCTVKPAASLCDVLAPVTPYMPGNHKIEAKRRSVELAYRHTLGIRGHSLAQLVWHRWRSITPAATACGHLRRSSAKRAARETANISCCSPGCAAVSPRRAAVAKRDCAGLARSIDGLKETFEQGEAKVRGSQSFPVPGLRLSQTRICLLL